MRVQDSDARHYYLQEAAQEGGGGATVGAQHRVALLPAVAHLTGREHAANDRQCATAANRREVVCESLPPLGSQKSR